MSNIRSTRTAKQYKNAGWHITYCFEIYDIIRKFESSAHTENNREIYKDKDYLLKCIKEGKNILYEKEQFIETEDNELPHEKKSFQEKKLSIEYIINEI